MKWGLCMHASMHVCISVSHSFVCPTPFSYQIIVIVISATVSNLLITPNLMQLHWFAKRLNNR